MAPIPNGCYRYDAKVLLYRPLPGIQRTQRRSSLLSQCALDRWERRASDMQGTRGGRGTAGDNLRINAKKFHLTYAACYPDELDKQYLIARAKEWARPHGGLKEFSVGREDHKEPSTTQAKNTHVLTLKWPQTAPLIS